ncbi:methionine/alanine import family NSS transporter small subunit [Mobilicoccus caccae]|nr:methionine/alanine import family NSS transporter small subunit [Mobilicoccus caccae]
MSTAALIMMLCYLAVIWGGLLAALLHLRANPDE